MLEDMLAPPQLYVLLAITIATFGWLLRPGTLGELPSEWLMRSGALILAQFVHLWTANTSLMPVWFNNFLHLVILSAYFITMVALFAVRWAEDKSKPPDLPDTV